MTMFTRKGKVAGAIATGILVLFCTPALGLAEAHGLKTRYPHMAPVGQYLMSREAEIALARSAAPPSISSHATVLVLGRHGYETAMTGTNGFVCLVERGWDAAFNWPQFWNPKIRGANCLNAPAARSVLPTIRLRTDLVLSGLARQQIIERTRAALNKGTLPALEPGAMSYMMSKQSYLTDAGDHDVPHVMFYVPFTRAAVWGAGLPGSPVEAAPYWFMPTRSSPRLEGFPPIRVFIVIVGKWSDGTAAP